MKMIAARILPVLALVIAASCAGCSGPDPATRGGDPAWQPTPAVVPVSPDPAASSIVPAAGSTLAATTLSPAKVFGEYRWAVYRNNITQTLPPNPRYQWEMQEKVEHSETTYEGMPAIHEKITEIADYPEWVAGNLVTTRDGYVIVADMYFSPSTRQLLGGSMTTTVKGKPEPAVIIKPDPGFRANETPSYFMGFTPFGEMDIPLTDEGTESITVPAGIYPDARRFHGIFRDGTPITIWVVSGIPVPIQYQFPNKYLDGIDPFQSFELVGWG